MSPEERQEMERWIAMRKDMEAKRDAEIQKETRSVTEVLREYQAAMAAQGGGQMGGKSTRFVGHDGAIYRQSELNPMSYVKPQGVQFSEPQTREVEQVLVDLNQAIERLCKAVAAINDRTKAVQDPREPEGKLAGGQVRGYSSPLAQGLSMNTITIEAQCEKLEELDRRIQL